MTETPERMIISGLELPEVEEVLLAFTRRNLIERARREGGGWAAIELIRAPLLKPKGDWPLYLCGVITFDDVQAAARRLDGVAHRTPVITSGALDEATGAGRVLLKAENLQRVGAFKFRGAYNAISTLNPDGPRARAWRRCRRGNHAQAVVARGPAARDPRGDPDARGRARGQARRHARLRRRGRAVRPLRRGARRAAGANWSPTAGLTPIHPYDNPYVMAGQGTAALELIEDAGPLDVLLVCLGGGGLLSGCATATAALSPGHPHHRRRAGGGRRLRALPGGRRADRDRGPAHDRRRPADQRCRAS